MNNLLTRLFGRDKPPLGQQSEDDESLVPVFVPPLVTLLVHHEREKGYPLTEHEVMAICGNGVCMNMRASMARQMAEKRGYADISPEDCWVEWQEFRKQLEDGEAEQEN